MRTLNIINRSVEPPKTIGTVTLHDNNTIAIEGIPKVLEHLRRGVVGGVMHGKPIVLTPIDGEIYFNGVLKEFKAYTSRAVEV